MKDWYEGMMRELPARSHDKIPIDFWGKSQGGYMLYDLIPHKGPSAPKLNEKTKNVIRYWGTDEERRNNGQINFRMREGGLRFAMMNHSKRRQGKNRQ